MAKQPLGQGKYYPHDTLKKMWLGGAPLGVSCDCANKRYLQKEDAAFKAFVSYCPFHGFDTSCWMCNSNVGSTEVCNKNHYPFSDKITLDEAQEMVGSEGEYAKQLVLEYDK